MKSSTSIERTYLKYDHLAYKYANKIHSYEQIAFEYEDLVQEFKLKIYTSILAYNKKWLKHLKEGYIKPVPLLFYIESSCMNKAKDFMKYISYEEFKISIEDNDFDYGSYTETEINASQNKFILNGIDLLEGLDKISKTALSMYLRGYTKKEIDKVILNKNKEVCLTTDEILENQKAFLISKYGEKSLLTKPEVLYNYSVIEE